MGTIKRLSPERLEEIRNFVELRGGYHHWETIAELLAHIDALEEENRLLRHQAEYAWDAYNASMRNPQHNPATKITILSNEE